MKNCGKSSVAAASLFGLLAITIPSACGQNTRPVDQPGELEYALALDSIEGLRIRESLHYLNHAIELNPRHTNALARRCWVKNELGQAADGMTDCEAALRLDRTNFDALRFEGDIDTDEKDYAKAKGKVEAALRIRPAAPMRSWGSLCRMTRLAA